MCNSSFYQTVSDFNPEDQAAVAGLKQLLQTIQTQQRAIAQAEEALTIATRTAAQDLQELPQAITFLTTNYEIFTEQQQQFSIASDYCTTPGVQQEINACFPAENIFAENLNILLNFSNSDFATYAIRLNPQIVETLQSMRSYRTLYQQYIQASAILIKLQTNRVAFEKLITDYTMSMLDLTGTTPELLQALSIANSVYSGYVSMLSQRRQFKTSTEAINLWKLYIGSLSASERTAQENTLAQIIIGLSLTETLSEPTLLPEQDTTYFENTTSWLQEVPEQYKPLQQDPAQAWHAYFSTQTVRENTLVTELKKRYDQTQHDLQVIEDLFRSTANTAEVQFMSADLSPELKIYIAQLTGNSSIINAALRQTILNYLLRKKENCEIDLLRQSADTAILRTSLARDFARIEELQSNYTRLCQEYESIAQTDPTAARLQEVAAQLNQLKYQLDQAEAALARKTKL
jgi:hypothetical protein